jgi:hypothetical protein
MMKFPLAKHFLFMQQWGWKSSGVALALIIVAAPLLVKPIGVSTQYVILNGIAWDMVAPDIVYQAPNAKSGYASSNAYLNKGGGKYAKAIAEPLNYSLIFVLSMFIGGFVASRMQASGQTAPESMQTLVARQRFGSTVGKRYQAAFLGGFLALFGARLAGGCTSGHMLSGMMQTSLSGYLFTFVAFLIAVPAARLLYKNSLDLNNINSKDS